MEKIEKTHQLPNRTFLRFIMQFFDFATGLYQNTVERQSSVQERSAKTYECRSTSLIFYETSTSMSSFVYVARINEISNA